MTAQVAVYAPAPLTPERLQKRYAEAVWARGRRAPEILAKYQRMQELGAKYRQLQSAVIAELSTVAAELAPYMHFVVDEVDWEKQWDARKRELRYKGLVIRLDDE